MKEIRPKINEVELDLLVEAMEKAHFEDLGYPRNKLLERFRALLKGDHKKKRIWRREN